MANKRARVELRDSATHTARGRTFKKGYPQILTNPADISYYQGQPSFQVTILDDKPAKPKKAAPPPKPETTEPETTGDDEGAEGDEDERMIFSKDKLKSMNKAQLVELAAAEFEVLLDGTELKADMIKTILEAQEALDEED